MSNPYGGNPYGNPGDQNPYGGPPGPPYGGGAPQPAYGAPQPAKTDGVSIAALVSSLVCCAPVAVVLGFMGLSRTKNGQRKGRGLAITGLVLGILGVIVWVLAAIGVAGGLSFLSSIVEPGEAKVGQCVNLDNDNDTNSVLMREADCTSEHDAEIVGVAEVNSDNIDQIKDQMTGFCPQVIDPDDLAKLADFTDDLNAVIEDPNDVNVGDHLVCYIESKRSAPIL
ncbi:DUF4190 domain-containing protein [Nocardioides panacisoli]|uniref:DUF4190 domain-containing protein n=1 Tax=Nocardioides panacisoli TaxID=627624 RepID=A0ABP7I2X4_9ACTN